MTALDEAGTLLRKAAADNEQIADHLAKLGKRADEGLLRRVNDRRVEIAEAFVRLAAVEAGLSPCCHPLRPAPKGADAADLEPLTPEQARRAEWRRSLRDTGGI